MKTMRIHRVLLCGVLTLAAAGVVPLASGAAAPVPATIAKIGAVNVEVRHSRTKELLANMPVEVRRLGRDADDQKPWAGLTNRYGTVLFVGLPDGWYAASINYNNHTVSSKFLIQDQGYVQLRLYFNPDID